MVDFSNTGIFKIYSLSDNFSVFAYYLLNELYVTVWGSFS